MLKVDFHTHSLVSGHALHTVEELLGHASRKGIEGLVISDHGPGMDNTIWLAKNGIGKKPWTEKINAPDLHYFRVLLSRYSAPEHFSTRFFKGIECNILGEGERPTDIPRSISPQFDIVIASIHPFPHLFSQTHPEEVTERLIMAMNDPMDILGHPGHKKNPAEMPPLVKAASEKGITLELNNSSLKLEKADRIKIVEMLRLAKKLDCRISLGSDAHVGSELGEDDQISAILEETQFPKELIVNRSLESALEFIHERKKARKEILKGMR